MGRPEERDFAGFRIVRPQELGEHASVWEAEDPESGERVAIETLAGDTARDEDVSEWFTEAWELASEIDERSVVRVLEIGEQDGVPFAVRAPAGEMTLAERLDEGGPLSPGAALQVLTEIGGGLETAHEAGVVHGALAPEVVALDEHGRSYLAGFGRREGDRREDVRALGQLLLDMLGDPPPEVDEEPEPEANEAPDADEIAGEAEAGADESEPDEAGKPEVVSAHELAHAEALREVGRTGADGGYARASDLIAAAKAAKPGRETGAAASAGNGGRGKVLAGVLAVVAVVVVVLLVSGGGDEDGDGDSSTVAETTPTNSTTSSTEPETTEPSTTTAPTTGPSRPVPVRGFPVGLSARDGVVYAVTRDGGSLDGFDEETGTRVLGPVGLLDTDPQDITVVDGIGYVTTTGIGTLESVDLDSGEVLASASAGAEPGPVIGALGSIWVLDTGGAQLLQYPLELSDDTEPVATPLDGAEQPVGMAFGAGSLWVSDASGKVLQVDPKDPSNQESFKVDGKPGSLIVIEDEVWVTDEAGGAVTRLDPATGKTSQIPVGGDPVDLAAEPDRLWVANADGYVTSVLLGTGATEQIDLSGAGGSPQGIAVGGQIWVTTGSGNTLVAIAPASS